MNAQQSSKPLTIIGTVLLLNGVTFLIISLAISSNIFLGPALGSVDVLSQPQHCGC